MSNTATFAVPCCNGERYLETMLRSLLAQTRRDFDIILVDDASEDESLALAQRVAGYELRGIDTNLMSYRRHGGNKSADETGTLNRFREEQRVLKWARQRGLEAGLLNQGVPSSSAVHNNLLFAVYQSLESGDSEQARQLLDFGRAQIPDFSRSITARLVALCCKLGRVGRGTLRLGLKLQQSSGL